MDIQVDCYSGYKADERPIRFRTGDQVHFVEELIERWLGLDSEFFRVRTDDGGVFLLCHEITTDRWTVEGMRPSLNG